MYYHACIISGNTMPSLKKRFEQKGNSSYSDYHPETSADRSSTGAFEALYALQNPEEWAHNPALQKAVAGTVGGSLEAPATQGEMLLLKAIASGYVDRDLIARQVCSMLPGERLRIGGLELELGVSDNLTISRYQQPDLNKSVSLQSEFEYLQEYGAVDQFGRRW
jgi:hypothetical protein